MSPRSASVESISGAQTFLYELRWLEHPAAGRFMCFWHWRICQLSFMKFIGLVELQDRLGRGSWSYVIIGKKKYVCVLPAALLFFFEKKKKTSS